MGISHHEWEERRNKIANTIDSLGNDYNTALYDGWLAYIKEMYTSNISLPVRDLKHNTDTMLVDD